MQEPEASQEPKRALVVAGHPDDPDFGTAGTVMMWSQQGWEFYFLVVTDGSKGTEDPSMTPDRLIPLRQREQRAAGDVYGVKDCFFLPYVDGELEYSRRLVGD